MPGAQESRHLACSCVRHAPHSSTCPLFPLMCVEASQRRIGLNEREKMKRIAQVALVAVSLVFLGPAPSAENNCRDVTGKLVEFFGGGSVSGGRLSNAGWLNGATLATFNSDGFPTPVPTAFSFTAAFTVATRHGLLKGYPIVSLRRRNRMEHGHDEHRSQGQHGNICRGDGCALRQSSREQYGSSSHYVPVGG